MLLNRASTRWNPKVEALGFRLYALGFRPEGRASVVEGKGATATGLMEGIAPVAVHGFGFRVSTQVLGGDVIKLLPHEALQILAFGQVDF